LIEPDSFSPTYQSSLSPWLFFERLSSLLFPPVPPFFPPFSFLPPPKQTTIHCPPFEGIELFNYPFPSTGLRCLAVPTPQVQSSSFVSNSKDSCGNWRGKISILCHSRSLAQLALLRCSCVESPFFRCAAPKKLLNRSLNELPSPLILFVGLLNWGIQFPFLTHQWFFSASCFSIPPSANKAVQ